MSTATEPIKKDATKFPPNPDQDPAGYLLFFGWKASGDPRNRQTLWIDPTKPEKDTEKPVEVFRRKVANNKEEIVTQIRITPRGAKMTRDAAVAVQQSREASGR